MKLTYACRNLINHPALNLIKIIGLSLTLSGILIIVLFLKNELRYDSYHPKADRLYRLTTTIPEFLEGKHFARIPNPGFVPMLSEYFPEIENYVRLVPIRGGMMKYKQNYIKIIEAFQVDSTFFDVFDSALAMGDKSTALATPGSMVVSESFAKKVCGETNPIGQILTIPAGQFYGKDTDFTIRGVMRDFPSNSHFHPEIVANPMDRDEFTSWAWTYLLLRKNANPDKIVSQFKKFIGLLESKNIEEVGTEAHLQPVADIHLHSNKLREIEVNSNISVIYTLSIAAFLLLFIAITNYYNLTKGMVVFSKKYLYVSKVFGSSGWLQLNYFLYEGILIVSLTYVLSGFVLLMAHVLIQKYFAINLFSHNGLLISVVLVMFGLLSILTGLVPIIDSKVNNLLTNKGQQGKSNRRNGISKGLIVLQYAMSMVLIVAVIVIYKQTNFAVRSGMGANENLICMESVHNSVQQKFEVFKAELLKHNSIKHVSAMLEPPGGEANDMFRYTMEGRDKSTGKEDDDRIGIFPCDYSFASIFDLEFLGGSNFSQTNDDHDGSAEYIINESAMQKLNFLKPDDIIGKEFSLISNIEEIVLPKGRIIGVVKDFHLSTVKKKVEPLVLFKRKDLWLIDLVISFQPGEQSQAIADVEKVWKNLFPEQPFEYEYVGMMYKNLYKTEALQAKLLSIFTLVALFICSIGLLGISLLTTQRRTKEIGIQKVNGAKTFKLVLLLNFDFTKWVLLAILIALPVSYFIMNKWLENFAYKTAISWWIFGLTGLFSILMALITVTLQSWKVANKNPIEALRYE